MTDDMPALIEKLETAQAGSRELDLAIAEKALGLRLIATLRGMQVHNPKQPDGVSWDLKPYTTSLDAALTLVPELATTAWSISQNPDRDDRRPSAVVMPDNASKYTRDGEAFANTPALALCIAALRARAA